VTTVLALANGMRPKQWMKNGILFAALIFSRHTFEVDFLLRATGGVALFCILSSCGYLFNDLLDIEADRCHPKKCKRPLASGQLPVRVAIAFMTVGACGALVLSFLLSLPFGFTALGYFTLTLSYTLYIKHLVILDVMAIAGGFILRAVAGAAAIQVSVSPWFLVCTAFGALFMAIKKRHSEILLLEGDANKFRQNLSEYSVALLGSMSSTVAAGSIMSYALYTFDVGSSPTHPRWLMLTIPFVVYGIFRYEFLVAQRGGGGAPELTILTDRAFLVNGLLYTLTVLAVLHLA